jgi:signal recognition particle GTPase
MERLIKDIRDRLQEHSATMRQLEQDLQNTDINMQQAIENTRSQVQQSLATVQQFEEDLHSADTTVQYLSEVAQQLRNTLAIRAERDEIMTRTPVQLPMLADPEIYHSSSHSELSLLENSV